MRLNIELIADLSPCCPLALSKFPSPTQVLPKPTEHLRTWLHLGYTLGRPWVEPVKEHSVSAQCYIYKSQKKVTRESHRFFRFDCFYLNYYLSFMIWLTFSKSRLRFMAMLSALIPALCKSRLRFMAMLSALIPAL